MSEKFENPDDVVLNKIIISSLDNSHQMDIKGMVISLEVTAGLGHVIYGSMIVADGIGLFSSRKNAAIGEEFIEVEFKTRGAKDFIKYKFIVSNMIEAGRSQMQDSVLMTLNLVSIDHFVNNGTFVSKSYKGNIHSVIQTILSSELKTDIPIADFDTSDGDVKFAFTKNKPFEKINLLTRYAYKNEQTSMNFFTFFENFKGYNFRTMAAMFTEEKGKDYPTYKYTPQASANRDDRNIILEYVLPTTTDIQRKLYHGYFKTNIYSYDMFTKQFQQKTYRLDQANLQPLEAAERGVSTQLASRLAELSGLDYFIPQDTSNPNSLIDSTISVSPYILQLEENMLLVKLYGNSLLDVGQLINVEFPLPTQLTGTSTNTLDTDISGRYLIQKIVHRIQLDDGGKYSYYNDVALVRNSSKTPQATIDSRYSANTIAIRALQ